LDVKEIVKREIVKRETREKRDGREILYGLDKKKWKLRDKLIKMDGKIKSLPFLIRK
jgi:hypothetical protein